MTWAQSIANEKLAIFASGTRVARALREALGSKNDSLLLAVSASKVGVKLVNHGVGVASVVITTLAIPPGGNSVALWPNSLLRGDA